jgi:streptogramin lyase
MPSQRVEIFGELMYPQVFEFNRDKTGPNDAWKAKGGATKLTLIMDQENKDKLVASGSRMKITDMDDGRYLVQLRRFWVHDTYPELGGTPDVVDASGKQWNVEENGLIGNGSTAFVKVNVYDTKTGKGTRLEGVQVINHVPYESNYDPSLGRGFVDRSSMVEGQKTASKAKATKKPEAQDLEDEIPF